MRKFVIGIAGNIGSGKTEAGEYFKKLGAFFIDADEIVSDLYKPGNDGFRKIVNYFGKEYLLKNGTINRAKLGKFVFKDENKLKILNYLIHPLVTNEFQKILDKTDAKVVAVEAAYFEKKHLLKYVDKVIWIDCKKEILKRRALTKKHLTEKMFEQILKMQKPYKPERIDFTVANNGSKSRLHAQLKKIWLKCIISP